MDSANFLDCGGRVLALAYYKNRILRKDKSLIKYDAVLADCNNNEGVNEMCVGNKSLNALLG